MDYLLIGKIIDSFSLDGTLKVLSRSDFSMQRYQVGNTVYLSCKGDITPYKVISFRKSGEIDFVKLEGINSKEEALEKKGYDILVDISSATLPQNYYHFYELEQCEVYSKEGEKLGHVKKVEEYPAQLTLRVSREGKDFFVPFVDEFIIKVDIQEHKIYINVIEGML